MKLKRTLITLTASIVSIATTMTFIVSSLAFARKVPNIPTIYLGKLNLDDYCQDTFGNNSRPVIVEENAYGWKCLVPHNADQVSYKSMDLDMACQTQYNDQNVLSGYLDWNDPYSWICWKPYHR